MSQWDFAVNFFVALFALIDPIGNVPLFAAATNGVKSKDARLISVYIALFVLGFLTFFYFSGLSLLEFFGISLPAFRIAGGVILFLLGWRWRATISPPPSPARPTTRSRPARAAPTPAAASSG